MYVCTIEASFGAHSRSTKRQKWLVRHIAWRSFALGRQALQSCFKEHIGRVDEGFSPCLVAVRGAGGRREEDPVSVLLVQSGLIFIDQFTVRRFFRVCFLRSLLLLDLFVLCVPRPLSQRTRWDAKGRHVRWRLRCVYVRLIVVWCHEYFCCVSEHHVRRFLLLLLLRCVCWSGVGGCCRTPNLNLHYYFFVMRAPGQGEPQCRPSLCFNNSHSRGVCFPPENLALVPFRRVFRGFMVSPQSFEV